MSKLFNAVELAELRAMRQRLTGDIECLRLLVNRLTEFEFERGGSDPPLFDGTCGPKAGTDPAIYHDLTSLESTLLVANEHLRSLLDRLGAPTIPTDALIELLADTLEAARTALAALVPAEAEYVEFGPKDCDRPLKHANEYLERRMREEGDAARAAGLCAGCGKEKPAPGAELCAGCEAHLAALERRAEGE